MPAVNVMKSELCAVVSAEIREARYTCFDSANDGRWETPHVKVLRSLLQIKNQSLRDSMALSQPLGRMHQWPPRTTPSLHCIASCRK